MKYGIAFANTMHFATAEGLVELAQGAEAAGFDSLWTIEHVVYPEGYESEYPYDASGRMPGQGDSAMPDPLIWLAFVAAATSSLRLATGILILPQRNPLVLAKECATLDALSGGRLELGVGVGWLEEEFDALGVPFADRGRRTDDHIGAMRAIWAADDASYDGEFSSWSGLSANPKPVDGTIPIHIGGHSRAAAERAGRLGDGFFPAKGDLPELIDIVRQTAADAGRDPDGVEITGSSPALFGEDPVGAVEELASWGVDRTIVPAFIYLRDTQAALAAFGETVIAPTADR